MLCGGLAAGRGEPDQEELVMSPEDGIALDPFCGTGTTMSVAFQLGRKSVGIDLAEDYVKKSLLRVKSKG
jgi:DNA modification methylase